MHEKKVHLSFSLSVVKELPMSILSVFYLKITLVGR